MREARSVIDVDVSGLAFVSVVKEHVDALHLNKTPLDSL
jgi:hypothetical protein